jgi:hypothetical protein
MAHLGVIWIISSRNVLVFSTIDNQNVIYPYLFAFSFSSSMLILLFNMLLASAIEKKIPLVGDACYGPPITIKSYDLHANDIRGVVGEIASYHKRD